MKKFGVILVFCIFLVSCNRDNDVVVTPGDETKVDTISITDLEVSESFDFAMMGTYTINLSYLNNENDIVGGVPFKIMDAASSDSLIAEKNCLYKGMTYKGKPTSAIVHIPTFKEKIYLQTQLPGYIEEYEIKLGSIREIDIELGGEGPTVTKSSTGTQEQIIGDFTYLYNFDNDGVPEGFVYDPVPYSNFLVIFNSFPEGKPLYDTYPSYFENGRISDIILKNDGEIDISFVHEGAGFRNALGYFYYDTETPPVSPDEIDEYFIAFPNTSYYNSGGGLRSGYKTQLQYRAEDGTLQNTFPAGKTVSFFLVADGWDRNNYFVRKDGKFIWYSFQDFNMETDPAVRKHHVMLRDDKRELFVIGIEDINRQYASCDQDFNDAMFYAHVTPYSAADLDRYESVAETTEDSDGDGVIDAHDDYPNDPEKAYDYHYPSKGNNNTLVWEDLWPAFGDYDCNDMVIDYNLNFVISPDDKIVETEMTFILRATGAALENGFGVEMPFVPSNVESVTGYNLTEGMIEMMNSGLESGHDKAVYIIFDNCDKNLFIEGLEFVNTNPSSPKADPISFVVKTVLKEGVDRSILGDKFFNPFIFIDKDRGRELHLKNYPPTAKANPSYFGTRDDRSSLDYYYMGLGGLPWALNISFQFDYPTEASSIIEAYPHFSEWCSSNGSKYPDWMMKKVGYRNTNFIFLQ